MSSPAIRPATATPQQRANARAALGLPRTPYVQANALAWVVSTGRAGMRASYADQRDAVADRLSMWEMCYPDDPEVRRLTEEVRDVR